MFRLFVKILEGEKKMSGLEQKAKTLGDFIDLYQSKDGRLPRAKLEMKLVRLEDAEAEIKKLQQELEDNAEEYAEMRVKLEDEIENLKAELEKHAWYCIDCDEWHTKGKICVVHEVRKMRNGRG